MDIEHRDWQPHTESTTGTWLKSIFDHQQAEQLAIGFLNVEVIEAANLPGVDIGGLSDPYVDLELSGFYGPSSKKQLEWGPGLRLHSKTHAEPQTLDPKWRVPAIKFPIKRHGAVLKVRLFDYDELGADDPLGHCLLHVNNMVPGETLHGWFALKDPGENAMKDVSLFDDEMPMEDHSGPGVRLKVTLHLDTFGELCSYLWAPPEVPTKASGLGRHHQFSHLLIAIDSWCFEHAGGSALSA